MKYILSIIFIAALIGCSEREDEPLSNEFRDVTSQLSVQDFEKIKTQILDSGVYEPFFNKYVEQPIYSFDEFSVTLLPEVGQLNISCDPQISDFNQLVIFDSDLQSKYIYFLIIRKGDMDKENIEIPDFTGLKENKVYLLRYSDHDIDEMVDQSEYYITMLKDRVD